MRKYELKDYFGKALRKAACNDKLLQTREKWGIRMVYVVIALGIFLLDSVIKFLIEVYGKQQERIPVFGGRAYLTKCYNKGAFRNLGESRSELVKYVSVALTLGCLLIFVFTLGRHGKHLLKLGLSMLLGGSFSNTYDRMSRKYVVDYLGFSVENKKISNTVFNVSDFFIMIGAAFITLSGMLPGKRKKKTKTK